MSSKKTKSMPVAPIIDYREYEVPASETTETKKTPKTAEKKEPKLNILSPGVAISGNAAEEVIRQTKTGFAKEKKQRGESLSEEEEYELRFEESFSKRKNSVPISSLGNELYLDVMTCLEYGDGTKQAMYIDMLEYLVKKTKPQIKDFDLLRNREEEKLRRKHRESFDKEHKKHGR